MFVFGTILVSTIDKPARLTIRVLWFSFLISDLSDQKLESKEGHGDNVYITFVESVHGHWADKLEILSLFFCSSYLSI